MDRVFFFHPNPWFTKHTGKAFNIQRQRNRAACKVALRYATTPCELTAALGQLHLVGAVVVVCPQVGGRFDGVNLGSGLLGIPPQKNVLLLDASEIRLCKHLAWCKKIVLKMMGFQLPVSQLVFSPDFWAMSRKTTLFKGVPGCNPHPFLLSSFRGFFFFGGFFGGSLRRSTTRNIPH